MWTTVYRGRETRHPDAKGLHDLACLLAGPGVDIHVGELSGRALRPAAPMLDDRARREYRRRLAELQVDIDDADAAGDGERAARTRVEHDALVDQLSAAFGRSGRPRTLGADTERARKAVSKRIWIAVDDIHGRDADLGRAPRGRSTRGTTAPTDRGSPSSGRREVADATSEVAPPGVASEHEEES